MMFVEFKKMNTNNSPPWRCVGVGHYNKVIPACRLPDGSQGRHGIFLNYGLYGQTLLDYKYENVYDLGKSRNSLRTIM